MNRPLGPLSPFHSLPLYVQLANLLRRQIEEGALGPGQPVPTEAELCERHAISRATVRQALGLLVDEGLILRQRGRGSYVAPVRPVNYAVAELRGFTETLVAQGRLIQTRLLNRTVLQPPEDVQRHLELDEGEQSLFFERLISDDEGPILLDSGYIPAMLGVAPSAEQLTDRPLYRLLEGQLGVPLLGVRQVIEAVNAGGRESELLGVDPGAALLRVSRLAYGARERPLLYSLGHFRADRYQERLWLRRPGVAAETPAAADDVERRGSPS
jgi:GntR family transcriptional regulator